VAAILEYRYDVITASPIRIKFGTPIKSHAADDYKPEIETESRIPTQQLFIFKTRSICISSVIPKSGEKVKGQGHSSQ